MRSAAYGIRLLLIAGASLVVIATASRGGEENAFFLNGVGLSKRYHVFRYLADGTPSPPHPVISPGDAEHVAWPSAFKLPGGRVRVYASRYYEGAWRDLAYWESDDGKAFEWGGVALAADQTEPFGIGPTQVYFDPESEQPFHVVYLVRNAIGTGNSLWLATSRDGVTWIRQGLVLATSELWEAAGFSPSYVTKSSDGTWILFYQGYETISAGPAAIATAPSARGPFSNKQVIFWPSNERLTITGGRAGTNIAAAQGRVRLGEPYVLRSSSGTEVITPIHQDGNIVLFERPLIRDYVPGEMAHIAAAKVDPSYAWETPSGWRAIFTGYGQFEKLLSEYTFSASAPSYAGPWHADPSGIRFRPWLPENLSSAENPTPLEDATRVAK